MKIKRTQGDLITSQDECEMRQRETQFYLTERRMKRLTTKLTTYDDATILKQACKMKK